MSRASSHALKHPPVTAPSEPAGATPFPELAVAIERERRRGRGAQSNASGRFEAEARVAFDDGWQSLDELPPFKTTVALDTARKVITRNDSPDIGFDRSINPYRGCEHGCVYCFARPTHAYLGLSPGLDFEFEAVRQARRAGAAREGTGGAGYEPRMIAIGTNTDPYQPIEREHKIMRGILEVLERAGHPVGIVTKSALVTRDIDILSRMAKRNLAKVALSVTTLDPKLARTMEPRASTPTKRLEALRQLSEAGIPATVMVAPIIPALNDPEIERILDAAAHAGAREASYVLLRLPLEVRDLFREWLMANYPDRYRHVFTLIRDMRGGGLRLAMGHADEGHRPDGLDDRPPLRDRLRKARPQQAALETDDRSFRQAEAQRAAIEFVLRSCERSEAIHIVLRNGLFASLAMTRRVA